MKTLVVLSALVSLTLAAPAAPGEGLEDKLRTQEWHLQAPSSLADVVKREKKSPSDISTSSIPSTGLTNSEDQNVLPIESGTSAPMARNAGLKKPLIVIKKFGNHHLYRDSEEEKANADSNETCARQVKVKLCDGHSKSNAMRSSTSLDSDIHMSEDDVKHSIKMAKEAVENLQRDLKKMDHNTATKTEHESDSDIELHEDIETARKALEHIHKNFGNLESMNLHATSSKDSDTMQDVHITVAKTDEERMAQWKEAMNNIQKNVEIARNIEDSFKSASHQESLLRLEQSKLATDKKEHHLHENINSQSFTTDDSHSQATEKVASEVHHVEKQTIENTLLHKAEHEHKAREHQNTEDDMKTSASTLVEKHEDGIKSQESLSSQEQNINLHPKIAEEKLDEFHAHNENKDLENTENIHNHHQHHHDEKSSEIIKDDMSTDQSEHHITQLPSMKTVEEETKLAMDKDSSIKSSEVPDSHMIVHTISNNVMKPSSDNLREHPRNEELEENTAKTEEHLNHGKIALETNDEIIDFLAKSADQTKHDENEKKLENAGPKTNEHEILAKSAEVLKTDDVKFVAGSEDVKPHEAIHSPLLETETETIDNTPKSAEHLELENEHNTAHKTENVMMVKSADQVPLPEQQQQHLIEHQELSHIETLPAAKSTEEHLHHLNHMHNHWAHENRHLEHLPSMKAVEESKDIETHGHGRVMTEHEMDLMRNSYMAEHGHMPSNMGASHDFELSGHGHHHAHHPMRYHNQMTHSNMHDMSGMGSAMHHNFHPSMREAMEGFNSEHTFRWKPTHESARMAYGSGLSSSIGSGGAVGVFPNANTGGCGIPLLLSCSPSVVSGSLAKAHSTGSFSAPSYRTEEDFGFHNKRDIKKTSDIRNTLRSPAIVKQKNPVILENKL